MKISNKMRASFPARSVNEALARTLIAAFAATVDPTVDELSDVKTAVSEAVTNCIVHGYRDQLGQVYIAASLYPDGRLVVRVRDAGCGIPDVKKAMEPLYTTCESGERAWGLPSCRSSWIRCRSTRWWAVAPPSPWSGS